MKSFNPLDISVILIVPFSAITIYFPIIGIICFSALVILFWWVICGYQKLVNTLISQLEQYNQAAAKVRKEVKNLMDLFK